MISTLTCEVSEGHKKQKWNDNKLNIKEKLLYTACSEERLDVDTCEVNSSTWWLKVHSHLHYQNERCSRRNDPQVNSEEAGETEERSFSHLSYLHCLSATASLLASSASIQFTLW